MAVLATQALYNAQRAAGDVLAAYCEQQPSITIHLNDGSFRFGRQPGIFTFDSPAAAFLDCIRAQRVPVGLLDVFGEAGVPFRDGCLLVEIHDHRRLASTVSAQPTRDGVSGASAASVASDIASAASRGAAANVVNGSTTSASAESPLSSGLLQRLARASRTYFTNQTRWPFYGNVSQRSNERNGHGSPSLSNGSDENSAEIYRIVLFPTSETVWQDLKDLDAEMGGVWTDEEALRVEAGVLVCATTRSGSGHCPVCS